MTTKEINQSIESMKVDLKKGEWIQHWLNVVFLIFIIGMILIVDIQSEISNGEFPMSGLILVTIFCLIIRNKLISPKLEAHQSEITEEQFKQANQSAAKLNEWVILSNRNNYFSAIKGTGWQWEGIKITAILKSGKVYLNSMVNPSIRSNPFTFGLNKKNKLQLIRQYKLIIKGENVVESADKELEKREKRFWEESEWSFKNVLKRVIGYGLSIPFIGLGIWMISTGKIEEIGVGLFLVGLCSSYIYQDIQVIREKRKRKKKPDYNNA